MAKAVVNGIELPEGILKSDLEYPKDYKDHVYDGDFELWYTEGFGWCIPTLLISKNNRNNYGDRTYAVRINDGGNVRIGRGPHVKAQVKVYARKDRMTVLQKYLDIRTKGSEAANTVRDRISTRRLQGQQHRMLGHTSWRW